MDEVELTELTDIEVVRQDAVQRPASGFPVLIMKAAGPAAKAVNAQGGINEKPDIAGAEGVLQDIARLIQSEAAEMAVGNWSEQRDIALLCEAASLMSYFRSCEMDGDVDDGLAKDVAGFVAKRKISHADRMKLASEGKALPDGSYPIENEGDLHNAAILARSGHGDVAAAKRHIAKMAKELGVPNPLADNDTKKDAPEGETPETSAPEGAENGDLTKETVTKMIDDAVSEVRKADEQRIEALKAELAVLKATPIPGQVALTAPPSARSAPAKSELLKEVDYYRRQVGLTQNDREASAFYQGKLREAEQAVAALK